MSDERQDSIRQGIQAPAESPTGQEAAETDGASGERPSTGDRMEIQHDREGQRFVKRMPEGEAELTYAEEGGVLDLQHTYVPTGSRGQGVGGSLAAHAFEHARGQGLRVRATCHFVQGWLKRNPQQGDIVV